MKFRNTHPTGTLNFSLGGKAFAVPSGAEVEIEDRWVATVVARGLLLAEVKPEPEKAPAPAPTPAPKAEEPKAPEPDRKSNRRA